MQAVDWMLLLSVAVAGGLGASARYGMQKLWPASGAGIPLGVLAANVAGSLIAGAALGIAVSSSAPGIIPAIIITGFCGGLTTFSTFAVETVQLAQARAWRASVVNVLANLVIGVTLAFLSYGLCITWLASAA
jgi:CrcB protein